MRADLHLHTLYSDGIHTPEEVAKRAAEAGVKLIAFTDHDSMEGAREKRAAAERYGLFSVPGWEVSSYCPEKVHVLGYCCRDGEAYRAFLQARRRGAYLRAEDMISKANGIFSLSLTLADAEEFHKVKTAPVHTMHVVKAFAAALGQADYGALYNEYFAYGKPAFSGLYRPTPEEAIDVVHASGGIAVLAHPARIPMEEERRKIYLETLVSRGLDGIECYHSTHTASETEYFLRFARGHGLLVTGGSDFHADGMGRRTGFPPFEADEALLRALEIPS